MTEAKQYVIIEQENGRLLISEDVISAIISQAVNEVDGVVGLSARYSTDITDFLNKKNWGRSTKITVNDDNSLEIDCNIVVAYGQPVVSIAEAVQEAIKNALTTVANVSISKVDVRISGIVQK